jgi:hypothetical protein
MCHHYESTGEWEALARKHLEGERTGAAEAAELDAETDTDETDADDSAAPELLADD